MSSLPPAFLLSNLQWPICSLHDATSTLHHSQLSSSFANHNLVNTSKFAPPSPILDSQCCFLFLASGMPSGRLHPDITRRSVPKVPRPLRHTPVFSPCPPCACQPVCRPSYRPKPTHGYHRHTKKILAPPPLSHLIGPYQTLRGVSLMLKPLDSRPIWEKSQPYKVRAGSAFHQIPSTRRRSYLASNSPPPLTARQSICSRHFRCDTCLAHPPPHLGRPPCACRPYKWPPKPDFNRLHPIPPIHHHHPHHSHPRPPPM